MTRAILIGIILFIFQAARAQVFIHAHNDYEKSKPLYNALENKVYSLEADVLLLDGQLFVAHAMQEIDHSKTLESMYIRPLLDLFIKNNGSVSPDTGYAVTLMIDIKTNAEEALKELVKMLEPVRQYFDRSLNRKAVQIVISGARGKIADWNSYPRYIYFDGRPEESYDANQILRVAFISGNFKDYVNGADPTDWTRLKNIIQQVHQSGKLVRFWATPDSENGWMMLQQAGVDIINTDRVEACRKFFR
jgi:glycerophosphoryl diester phosphodiesterase